MHKWLFVKMLFYKDNNKCIHMIDTLENTIGGSPPCPEHDRLVKTDGGPGSAKTRELINRKIDFDLQQ
jgi:hypothetical protein